MILRFRDKNGLYHITAAEYIEVEDIYDSEIHNGKWVFRDAGKKD